MTAPPAGERLTSMRDRLRRNGRGRVAGGALMAVALIGLLLFGSYGGGAPVAPKASTTLIGAGAGRGASEDAQPSPEARRAVPPPPAADAFTPGGPPARTPDQVERDVRAAAPPPGQLLDAEGVVVRVARQTLPVLGVEGAQQWETGWSEGFIESLDGRPQVMPPGISVSDLTVVEGFGRVQVGPERIREGQVLVTVLRVAGPVDRWSAGTPEEGAYHTAVRSAQFGPLTWLLLVGDPGQYSVRLTLPSGAQADLDLRGLG